LPLNPQIGADGRIIPHDDPEIAAESWLIRHINPDVHVCEDENLGRRRISSAAFSATTGDPDYGMSVDLGQLLVGAGLSEDARVPPGFGAVRLRVARVRVLALRIGSDPTLGAHAQHGQVWDVKSTKRSKIRQIVEGWVVELIGVAL